MLKLVVVLAIVACTHAAPSNNTLGKNPGTSKDGQDCYIEALDVVIAFGEKAYSSKPCLEYTCTGNSGTVLTCGSEYARPPCKMVIDEDKSFPDCCPRWICP